MKARDGYAYVWITDNEPGRAVTRAVYPTLRALIANEKWFDGLEVARIRAGVIVDV